MEKTWKVTTAGILTIISGAVGIGVGASITMTGGIVGQFVDLGGMLSGIGGGVIGIGIIALIGGIFALRRQIWGLALAGSILAIICMPPLGVLAVIFLSMGKREFA